MSDSPATTPASAAGAAVEAPVSELEALRREVADWKDKCLRAMADARNVQARAQREKEESLRFAEADFARELLNLVDDMARTVESAQGAADAVVVADGVRMMQEQLLKVFRSRGILPIETVGKPFDPALHEALMQQPADAAAGTILQEVACGFQMHGRALRPARVIVSGGK